jgi:hypothetical protein
VNAHSFRRCVHLDVALNIGGPARIDQGFSSLPPGSLRCSCQTTPRIAPSPNQFRLTWRAGWRVVWPMDRSGTDLAMSTTIANLAGRDSDDSVLVARCLAGDDASWHMLVSRYGNLVEALIRRYHLPSDEQADVLQDVWVEVWKNLPAVRSRSRLGPWLATVAGRLAWDAR